MLRLVRDITDENDVRNSSVSAAFGIQQDLGVDAEDVNQYSPSQD